MGALPPGAGAASAGAPCSGSVRRHSRLGSCVSSPLRPAAGGRRKKSQVHPHRASRRIPHGETLNIGTGRYAVSSTQWKDTRPWSTSTILASLISCLSDDSEPHRFGVPRLDSQRLGDPESGLPLDQEQQPRLRARSGPYQRVNLVPSRYSGTWSEDFSCGSRRGFGCCPLGLRVRWARAVAWLVVIERSPES